MKHKATEKLFNIVYMDSLTETYNRVSYDERLKKLRRNRTLLNNMTVVVINLYELQQIIAAYGLHTGDEAVCLVAGILKKDHWRTGGYLPCERAGVCLHCK